MSRHRLLTLFGGNSYADKVMGYSPIAYWPLTETSGTTAVCQVNPAQNGTYIGPTLANGTAPDGSPCPLFDGANDRVDAFTATLAAAFNGAEFTITAWARVLNVGVWTDGDFRYIVYPFADANNRIRMRKSVDNTITDGAVSGGVTKEVAQGGLTETGWMHVALTNSEAADELKHYYNGAQSGATQTLLGNWAGALIQFDIGSIFITDEWLGWLYGVAVFGSALAQPVIADLATV